MICAVSVRAWRCFLNSHDIFFKKRVIPGYKLWVYFIVTNGCFIACHVKVQPWLDRIFLGWIMHMCVMSGKTDRVMNMDGRMRGLGLHSQIDKAHLCDKTINEKIGNTVSAADGWMGGWGGGMVAVM